MPGPTKKSLMAIVNFKQEVRKLALIVAFGRTYLNELLLGFLSDQIQIWIVYTRQLDNEKLLKDFS